MITVLLGQPGAGKSYEAVRMACKAVEGGRHVMTNLPLVGDYWDAYEGYVHRYDDIENREGWLAKAEDWTELLEPKWLVGEGGEQKGALVIIDEVVRVFSPERMRGTSSDLGEQRKHVVLMQTSVENMISTHRHARLDVVFLGQVFRQLPEWLRGQVGEWIELRSHKLHGLPGYSWFQYDTWYGAREPLSSGARKYHKEIFGRYRSHALGGGEEGDDRAHGFAYVPLWRRWQIWLAVVAVGGLVFVVPMGWDLFWSVGQLGRMGEGFGGYEGEAAEEDGAVDKEGLGAKGNGDPSLGEAVDGSLWQPGQVSSGGKPLVTAAAVDAQRGEGQGLAKVGVSMTQFGALPLGWPGREVSFVSWVGPWVEFGDGSVLHEADFLVHGVKIELRRPCVIVGRSSGMTVTWRCAPMGDRADGEAVAESGMGVGP